MSSSTTNVPILFPRPLGLSLCALALVGAALLLWPLRPVDEAATEATTETITPPPLATSAALASWMEATLTPPTADTSAQLEAAWDDWRGKFSTLPKFHELPAALKLRSFSAAITEDQRYIIAAGCDWDAETLNEKLRPVRDLLAQKRPHRVDAYRSENGVLIEQHGPPEASHWLLRHNGWLVMTNHEPWIKPLTFAVQEPVPSSELNLDPAFPALHQLILPQDQ
ncbi:hypothetical protein [Sulfuriroseicoccus oceanibius]|uniref:Uncharacterized protein n=1 Tax=Sulfuriroseicoccus oceanibius TaxID=2707525 RepID=A0A6B3L1N9_9BACT|nr:hypothetical protein [Sulfuriroseicoccus oceanibius]QQL46281.1 hypothetical protein G3M56_006825 [Sulfuriroseicoccus oceanibius]